MRKLFFFVVCIMILTAIPVTGQLIDESFESGSWPAGWVIETISGNTWYICHSNTHSCDGSYTADYCYNYYYNADSWFFTKGVSLTAGSNYMLEFQYRVSHHAYVNNLRVRYGTGQSSAGMTTTIFDHYHISSTTCLQAQVPFTVASTGTYYLGFQCYSSRGQLDLFVDDIVLTELIIITPNPVLGTKCTIVPMNVANNSGTSQSFTFSHTAPTSLYVSFNPNHPTINDGANQDVDVTVTPVTPNDWNLISFNVTATGDTTADSDTAVFDAYPNYWEDKERSYHGDYDVAAVSDGTYIYKFGGWQSDRLERYNPATNTWMDLSSNPYHSFPSPTGACYVDGSIYFLNSAYGDPGNMYRYHVATDTYYQVSLPPEVTTGYLGWGGIVYYCGNLWIMGAYNNVSGAGGTRLFSDIHFWKFNIASSTWTEITSAPAIALRAGQGMVQKNGKIYVLGGQYYTDNYYLTNSVYEYDIATDTWSNVAVPSVPGPGYCQNNKAWMVGSYIFLDDGAYADKMWVFKINDPAWTSWKEIASMTTDQFRYGAAYQDGAIYAVNGCDDYCIMQAMSFCPLIANAGSGFCVCPDFNGNLDLGPLDGESAVGGTPGYTYSWSDGLGWTSTLQTPTYAVNPANLPITITLTVTDSISSTDTDTVTIVSYPPLVVDAGPDGAGSPGTVYSLGGTPTGTGTVATGGNLPYTYSWTCTEDPGWTSALEHPTYTLGAAGNIYHFYVTVTDDCSTLTTDNVTVTSGDLHVNPGANRAICIGDSTVLGGHPTAYDGVIPYTYAWTSVPAGFTSSQPNPTVSPTVSTRYTVTVYDVMNPGGISATMAVDVVPYLNAPTMLTPADGSNLPDLYVDPTWTDTSNEIGYKLHLSDAHGHIWTFTTSENVTSFPIDSSMGVLSRGECYYWWVQAFSDGTYCDSWQSGTFDFCIDSLPEPIGNTLIFASDQVTKGDLTNTRTNLGLISLSSGYLEAHLTLRNAQGTILSTVDLPVGYNEYAAYVDLLDYFPAPYNEGSIDIKSPDSVYLVGGLVDNATNDPSIYPQDIESSSYIMTPIVLRNDDWKTQVVLRNLSDQDLEVTMTTYIHGSAPSMLKTASVSTVKTMNIPAQGYFKSDDIMRYMMDPHVYALFTAEVTAGTGEITGFARQMAANNMGGIYPFYSVSGGHTAMVFPYVVDDTERRSNIGLANMNAMPISVEVAFIRDGFVAGAKAYAVDNFDYLPINNVIRDVTGTTGIQYVSGFLALTSASPFRVVGGPIDNLSNDPSVFGGYTESFEDGFTPLVLRSGPWTSRLVLANMGGIDVDVDLVLYQNGEPVGTISRTVDSMDIFYLNDVIGAFTIEDLFGSLFIYADGPVYGFVEQTTGPGGASGVYPVFNLD